MFGIFLLSLLASACESWLIPPDPPSRPEVIFNQLWEDIHNRYAFFEHKEIDWPAMGEKYRARITADLGEKELFELMGDMLFELKDGHVSLHSHFGRSKHWEWFSNYPGNYNEANIHFNYLRHDHRRSGPLFHQIIDSVLYITYRSFGRDISDQDLEAVTDRAKGLKGVIVDIRNNGGGNLKNAYKLAACFVDRETTFAFQRVKNGSGPADFSDWEPMTIAPGKKKFLDSQVVVLTNRKSYSASTFFAQMMRVLPHVTLIGDNTGGGGGTPAYGELSNGWIYRFSATQTIDLQGNQLEDGVPSTFSVRLHRGDEIAGKDSLIDEAIAFLSGTSSFNSQEFPPTRSDGQATTR